MQGQELKILRNKLRLTQRGLASWVSVTTNKISNWENGRTPIPEVVRQRLDLIEAKFNKDKKSV